MSEFVMLTEEYMRMFYDPATCSYRVPIGGKVAHDLSELREENVRLRAKAERQTIELARLNKKNEKLRLLVCGLDYCSDELNSAECDRCPLHDATDENLEPKCVRMMRELGIDKEKYNV